MTDADHDVCIVIDSAVCAGWVGRAQHVNILEGSYDH